MNLILIFDLVYDCKFFWSEKEGSCRPIRQPLSQRLFTSLTYLICLFENLLCLKIGKVESWKVALFENFEGCFCDALLSENILKKVI